MDDHLGPRCGGRTGIEEEEEEASTDPRLNRLTSVSHVHRQRRPSRGKLSVLSLLTY
jgi:hypothetical protein